MDADEKHTSTLSSRAALARERSSGEDLTRIISLSDGVFAFALTLLVLTLTVPVNITGTSQQQSSALASALRGEYGQFVGYVFAFVMISIWWIAHHRTFRYIERYDSTLLGLNLALLLEIAVMPFVLEVYTHYITTQVGVVLFAASQVATGFTLNAIWIYATRKHRLVNPKLPAAMIRYTTSRGRLTPVVFLASIAITFVSVPAAEYTWIAVFAAQSFVSRYGQP